MSSNEEMLIRIDSALKISVAETVKGKTRYKEINPKAFLECIKNSVQHEGICSGILPLNCIGYSQDTSGRKYVVIDFPEKTAKISYEKTKYEDFPIPHLLFGFNIDSDGRINGVKLGVVERGRVKPNSKMYVYPFSNVSGFSLCTGSNRFPTITSLHQLNGLPYFILAMPNNNDRYTPANTKLEMEFRTLLAHLKDKNTDYYYQSVLKESPHTAMDFIGGGYIWR